MSSKSGNVLLSGRELWRFRRNSHCPAKLLTSACDFRIRQHALDLRVQNGRILELLLFGGSEEFIVRDAAPQEERQSRRQFEIAEPVDLPGRNVGRIGFAAEEELRRGDHHV